MEELLNKGLEYCLSNLSEFARAYKVLTGEDICSYCRGVIEAKFNELNNNRNTIKTMQERTYRMLPGKLIDTTMGDKEPWGQFTDKNMTDAIAEKLIGQGYGKYFKDVPKNESIEFIPVVVTVDEIENKIELQKKEAEAEIKLEVFEKKVEEPKEETTNSLDTYSYKRLVELCEKRAYPKEEWKGFSARKDILNYVKSK